MIPVLYLLDTNILVHLVRGDGIGQHIQADYAPTLLDPRPLISIVSEGELRSLTYQFHWGKANLNNYRVKFSAILISKRPQIQCGNFCALPKQKIEQSLFYLSYFKRASIDQPEIYEAYAAIDAYSISVGRSMGKNDLWIAATAHVVDATILTTDMDFDHLASEFLKCQRIDPTQQVGWQYPPP